MVKLATLQFNPFGENTYILFDQTKQCIIVDPGCCATKERETLDAFIEKNQLQPIMVVATHGHIDHVCGAQYVKKKYKIPFALHSLDQSVLDMVPCLGKEYGFVVDEVPVVDIDLAQTPEITLGDNKLEIIHTPGHSPGHIVIHIPGEDFLLSGDLIFKGSIGRTDLPGGSYPVIMESIIGKVIPLGSSTKLFPGHGPSTTLSHEIMFNPFIAEALNGEVNYKTNEN